MQQDHSRHACGGGRRESQLHRDGDGPTVTRPGEKLLFRDCDGLQRQQLDPRYFGYEALHATDDDTG
jgi:hypothetical protein